MEFGVLQIVVLAMYLAVPTLILYFVIKLAVKNALKELKEERIL